MVGIGGYNWPVNVTGDFALSWRPPTPRSAIEDKVRRISTSPISILRYFQDLQLVFIFLPFFLALSFRGSTVIVVFECSTTLDGFLLHVENDPGTVVCFWSFHCFERVECGDWVEWV